MPKHTEEQRHNATECLQEGPVCKQDQGDIARHRKVIRTAIKRLWARYTNRRSTRDRPRSCRPLQPHMDTSG